MTHLALLAGLWLLGAAATAEPETAPPAEELKRVARRCDGGSTPRPLPDELKRAVEDGADLRMDLLEWAPPRSFRVRAEGPVLTDSLAAEVRRILLDESSYPAFPKGMVLAAPMDFRITVSTPGSERHFHLGFSRGMGLVLDAAGPGGGVLGREACAGLLAIGEEVFPGDARLAECRRAVARPSNDTSEEY